MSEPVRCAVLSFAHVHAPSYAAALSQAPETSLLAIWDDDPARGREAAAHHGVAFAPDLAALLQRTDLNAVVITSENLHHRRLCEQACAAGKHVLCEKPLATTSEDAEAMIAAAERAGVVLATAFPMRHNLPAIRVKRAIASGEIGKVLAVRTTNHGSLPPGWFQDPVLAGGGAVMDHTVHIVDMLRWYLEDEPVEVYTEMSAGLFGGAVEDAGFLTITFSSGVVITLDPSWSRPPSFPTWGDITMEIAGSEGALALDAFAQKLILHPQATARTEWLSWATDGDAAMIADFAKAVRTGSRPAANGRDGERALAVVLAAYASARAEQPAPVPLPATFGR